MGKNLVVARVGGNSLHRCWLDRGRPREWDLYLSPYQEIPPQTGLECTVGEVIPGPKWSGLRELLTRWDGWRDYDHIWLPDDDVFATQDAIGAMFDLGAALDFRLFAPALHEGSYYEHFSTMRNRSFHARAVGFVEIMVPCFRRETLERLLPTLDLTTTGWGWGLDSVWPKLLDYEGVGILDATPVLHTRPVGQFRDAELHRRVNEESDGVLAQHGCEQRHCVFSAFGADLRPLPLDPDRLLVAAVEGWRYLFDQKPGVLASVVEHQKFRVPGRDAAAAGPRRAARTRRGGAVSSGPGRGGRRPDRVRPGEEVAHGV